jgi:hypothetical protein
MIIKSKAKTKSMAGNEWLKRQLEIDEANMHDYDRPLKRMKKVISMFTNQASQHGFIRGCVKTMLP